MAAPQATLPEHNIFAYRCFLEVTNVDDVSISLFFFAFNPIFTKKTLPQMLEVAVSTTLLVLWRRRVAQLKLNSWQQTLSYAGSNFCIYKFASVPSLYIVPSATFLYKRKLKSYLIKIALRLNLIHPTLRAFR